MLPSIPPRFGTIYVAHHPDKPFTEAEYLQYKGELRQQTGHSASNTIFIHQDAGKPQDAANRVGIAYIIDDKAHTAEQAKSFGDAARQSWQHLVDGKFLEQAWVVVFSSLDDLKGKFAKSQSQ